MQPAPASAVAGAAAPSAWLQQCSSHPATSRYTDKLVRAVGAHSHLVVSPAGVVNVVSANSVEGAEAITTHRDVDMITACVSSVNAVLRNKATMLLWGALIALLTFVGFATAFLGLVIIMPWLAYAAWHAYRETLEASAWPAM